ncbi:NAD(P)-binding protein, partial [Cylindrobasidium torrendii FP15055 ss-10]
MDAVNQTEAPKGAVVFLTRPTGNLGSAILSELIESPFVEKVFAVEPGPACSSKSAQKVVIIDSETMQMGFSMVPTLVEEIRASVTHIIHDSWSADLNSTVESYAAVLRGMRMLVDIAITSSHCNRFVLVSSVSTFQNLIRNETVPETALPVSAAIGTGYGESKWLGETILHRAAAETGLEVVVARMGQITGSKSGEWKTKDWYPAVIKTAVAMGSLPSMSAMCDWLTPETAAGALVDATLTPVKDVAQVVHVIHPRPILFDTLSGMFGKSLGLPVIPLREWLAPIRELPQSKWDEYPACRVMDILNACNLQGTAACFPDNMAVERGSALSKTLREAGPLSMDDVKGWLKYWTYVGYIAPKPRASL